MLARAAIAVVALVLIAWIGVLLRDEASGRATIARVVEKPTLSSEDLDAELAPLRDGTPLSPDPTQRLQAAELLLLRGERARAARAAQAVARDEPANRVAWSLVLRATAGRDPALAAQARTAIRRLDPLGARAPSR